MIDNIYTIERCPHDRENPYSMVSNALMRDRSISPECRMLLMFLLSNSQGWKIRTSQLAEEFEGYWGRDKILKIIKEAVTAGYMARSKIKEDGKFKGVKYFISESPKFKKCSPQPDLPGPVLSESAKFKKCSPQPDLPDPANQGDKQIPRISSKEDISKKKEQEGAAPTARSSKFIERALHISTSESDHQKLVKEHGEEKVQLFYKILSDWKQDTEKRRWKKDDYRSILRWVIDAESERSNRKRTKSSEGALERNTRNAQGILEKYKNRMDIHKGENNGKKYMEFDYGTFNNIIYFNDLEFESKVKMELKRRNLSWEFS